jgi:DNA repair protein RecO (recombination protein O)
MSTNQSEGIVLRTYNLLDGDKLAVVFTAKFGVVRGYAHGARKLKSKFGSTLEPLTIALFNFKQKENQESVRFEGTEIRQSYFSLSSDETFLNTTTYWCELLMEFLPQQMPDERIYRMVKACLTAFVNNPSTDNSNQLSCYFETWLLNLTGFLPDLKNCRKCRNKLTKDLISEMKLNGIVCLKCQNRKNPDQEKIYELLVKVMRYNPTEFSLIKTDIKYTNLATELIRSIIREAIEEQFLKLFNK